jgi:uncharacterized protein
MSTKTYYALKLIPRRPDFISSMTEQERGIMGEHLVYWKEYMERGMVAAFGPVMDPAGVYGLGIVGVESEEELQAFMKNDPAAAINNYEFHLMLAVVPDMS